MTNHDNRPSIEKVIAIAQLAGDAILNIYNTDFAVAVKSDQSPLTEADMASHHVIVDGLRGLAPETPVLSEESSKISFDVRNSWRRYWLVDPLDGTREFVKRNGEFTVNIALIEDGIPVLGVVQVPVTGKIYYGVQGQGAWCRDRDREQPPIPIRVQNPHQQPVRVAGSRSHAGDSLKQYLANLGDHEIVNMGSSLKLCLVAEGKADLYVRLGPTSEWDTAAAQAVVEAAGGQVTDTRMQRLRCNTKESLLNPHFFVFGDPEVDWSRFLAMDS